MSYGYPNLLPSPDIYLLHRTSTSGSYILLSFLPDTFPLPSKLLSISPSKYFFEETSSAPSSPPSLIPSPTTTTFLRALQHILTKNNLKTSKFTSLLLYPNSPYHNIYNFQLYPTSHIIIVTQWYHSYHPIFHTNISTLLQYCASSRTDSNQNFHRRLKYSTTYAIIHFYLPPPRSTTPPVPYTPLLYYIPTIIIVHDPTHSPHK